MEPTDFAALLESARGGAPRSEFKKYIPELSDPASFSDQTRLRLLGNAIADTPENAAILASRPGAIAALLAIEPLGIQVVYNGCVGNVSFAQDVLHDSAFKALKPMPASRNLIGAIWEVLEGDIDRSIIIRLVINGFVELVLADPTLETEYEIVAHFVEIYRSCQKITIAAQTDESGEIDDAIYLGFQVVGNISSHREFGLEQVRGIGEYPFTWDTVALLANLTAESVNLEGVRAQWPGLVPMTAKLIKDEDPEDEAVSGTPEYSDEDSEDEKEPPFDLGLWGPLFRNVARLPAYAEDISKQQPAKLLERLLSSPLYQEIGWDFAAVYSANVYDHDLTQIVVKPPHSGGTVLVAAEIVTGIVSSTTVNASEAAWAAPELAAAISAGLLADLRDPLWVKGTKALALLQAKYPETHIDKDALLAATQSDAARSNIQALS